MGEGRKKAKESRVVPHPKLNPGCATACKAKFQKPLVLTATLMCIFFRPWGWLKITDMKTMDHQNCRTGNDGQICRA